MKTKVIFIILLVIVLFGIGAGVKFILSTKSSVVPTPTPLPDAVQLTPDQYPKPSLQFSADAHYVTVNIANLHAASLEYDLVYEASVKNNRIQTGVNASAKIDGQATYSKQQLLGSESSGHFTYHTGIDNASLNLTLRDGAGRSIFQATYPFVVSAAKSFDLQASQ
jgi:hypothetical protein